MAKITLDPSQAHYSEAESAAFFERAADAARRLPGVRSAALTLGNPALLVRVDLACPGGLPPSGRADEPAHQLQQHRRGLFRHDGHSHSGGARDPRERHREERASRGRERDHGAPLLAARGCAREALADPWRAGFANWGGVGRDRRHRSIRFLSLLRRAAAGHGLLSVPSGAAQQHGARGAVGRRLRLTPRPAARDGADARSQGARLRRADDRGVLRRARHQHRHGDDAPHRRHGPHGRQPDDGRTLWARGVYGEPAYARDRHSRRDRGDLRPRPAHDPRAGVAASSGRPRRRPRAERGHRPRARDARPGPPPIRSPHVLPGRAAARAGGAPGVVQSPRGARPRSIPRSPSATNRRQCRDGHQTHSLDGRAPSGHRVRNLAGVRCRA